jgi:Tol biopolymer transport system component
MVMNADGSNQAEVYSNSEMNGHPSWSPDGTSIAFMIGVEGSIASELWRIDVTVDGDGNPQGSNPFMLTEDIYWDVAWSPDGDVIAFPKRVFDPSLGHDAPREIRTITATGESETTLYTASEGHRVLYPTWRSDASQMAFREQDTSGDHSIKVLDLTLPVGPDNPETVYGPVGDSITMLDWARTKDTLAYNSMGPDDLTAIYTLDLTEPDPTPQFVVGSESGSPSWSPDDEQIVHYKGDFSRGGRLKGWNVWQFDFATGEDTKLAKGIVPDWSRA